MHHIWDHWKSVKRFQSATTNRLSDLQPTTFFLYKIKLYYFYNNFGNLGSHDVVLNKSVHSVQLLDGEPNGSSVTIISLSTTKRLRRLKDCFSQYGEVGHLWIWIGVTLKFVEANHNKIKLHNWFLNQNYFIVRSSSI